MQTQPVFYKCPICNSIITGTKYLSGNTTGAVFFSDAYLEAAMMPPYGITYLGCPKCNKVFPSVPNEIKLENEEAKKAIKPMASFLVHKKLLALEKLQPFQEKAFLLWYLWDFNHKISQEEKEQEMASGDYIKNTDKLIAILSSERGSIDSRLLSVEVLRERGKFEEAQKALEGASRMIDQLQKIVEKEKENIEAKKTEVFKI